MTAPTPLSNDQIVTFAPAAGSFEPIDGVSARYSFVPTLTAVDLLRDAGCFPSMPSRVQSRLPDGKDTSGT
jgi:hypothetical protein